MSTATITIALPTQRTDGTALTPDQIASIAIFDSASATPATPIATLQGAATAYTTSQLAPGAHTFTAEVTDSSGNVSAMSNAATVTVPTPLAAPNPPTITAVLNS